MNMLIKFLGLATLAAALPLLVQSASAAEFRQPGAHAAGVNGHMTPAPEGLFAKAPEAKPIQVAGRYRGYGHRRGGGRLLGPAIVGGVIAGALIAGAARSYDRPHYYSRQRYANRCERWLWHCDNGERWACREFYRNCE